MLHSSKPENNWMKSGLGRGNLGCFGNYSPKELAFVEFLLTNCRAIPYHDLLYGAAINSRQYVRGPTTTCGGYYARCRALVCDGDSRLDLILICCRGRRGGYYSRDCCLHHCFRPPVRLSVPFTTADLLCSATWHPAVYVGTRTSPQVVKSVPYR